MKMEDVRWMRVLTCSLLLLLSVTIVEVRGSDVNIALNKPAVQSTTLNNNNIRAPENAVNGNTNDFSHTSLQSNQWWRVDLQGQYHIKSMRIVNRREDCCRDRLQQIYILTSNDNTDTPPDPHPHPDTAPDWNIRYYIVGPVGDGVSITLYLTEPSRHVAVFSQHDEGVTLAEVEIYSYNVQDAPSPVQTNSPTSSSVYSGFPSVYVPAQAVDRNINMFDSDSYFSSRQVQSDWWRVELQQACDQCSVVVYPYLRLRRTIEDGQFSRLSAFSIFSSNSQTPSVPNTSQNGWTTCLSMSGSADQRGPIRAQCSQNNTRWIAVYKNAVEALELAEVQVFQREPTFRSGSSVTVTGTNTSCVEISWPAADRASSYRWKCTNGGWSSQRVLQRERDVCDYPADTAVSCNVIAVGSGGVSSSIDGSGRTTCLGPTFTLSHGFPNNRRINIQNIQLRCTQVTQLTLIIYEGDSGTVLNTNPIVSDLSRDRVFNNLEPNQRYRVEGYTTRSGQRSLSTTKYLNTPEIPSGRVSGLTVAPSQNCVSLSWNPPTEPNGVITNYNYKCGDKNERTTGSAVRTGEQCGFSADQSVACSVWAVNGAGDGAQDSRTVRTFCAGPTFTLSDDFPANRRINILNIQLRCTEATQLTLIIYEGDSGTALQTNPITSDLSRDRVFNYLKPNQRYRVTGYTTRSGQTSPSTTRYHTTPEIPSERVSGLTVTPTSPYCVSLSWNPPTQPNGVITNYKYKCGSKNEKSTGSASVRTGGQCGFSPYQSVTCSVWAVNGAGDGAQDSRTVRTFCADPTNVRLSLEDGKSAVNGKDRRKITASIEAGVVPNCARIQRFTFELRKTQGAEVIQTKEVTNQNRGSVQFNNLDAVTNYKVVVIAVNDKGNQSLPVEESVETGELKPDTAPAGFTFQANASCVDMSWGPPVEPNGVITLYQGTCRINSTEVTPFNTTSQNHVLCGFPSATKVNCVVAASTSEGFGPEAGFNRSTGVDATEKSLGEPGKTSESTIQITIPQVIFTNKNTNLRYYLVIVQEISENAASEGKRRKRELTTKHPVEEVTTSRLPQIDQDLLYNFTDAKARNLTYYVTLRLEDKKQDVGVTIGDGSSSSGYYNRPLEPGKDYKLHYSYTVELDGKYITTVVSNDKVYRTAIVAPPPPPPLIALVVIPIVLLLVVAVLLIVWLRRRKNNDKNSKEYKYAAGAPVEMHGGPSQQAPTPINSRVAVKPPLPPSSTTGELYENVTMPKTSRVRTADLESFVMGNSKLIAEQYKMLEQLPTGNMTAAGLEENKGKNRYRGLYPVDDYRVVLRDNVQGTDFINASYINGFEKQNKFIAAMAPNPQTMNDFWHMIWQENVSVIVMVTKLVEDGKKKSEQYWPDLENKAGLKFGEISVTTMSDEVWADYAIRTIQAIRVENGQRKIRKITQYNYLTWPDHGVPKDTAPFILFYHKVFTSHKVTQKSPPILVHCSAGVGRTGTFIGLDYLLQDGAATGSVDLFECVKQMRLRRPNMVQKEEQYILMHHALTEYTTTSSFTTDSATMAQKLDNHDRAASGKESLIATEFTVIKKKIARTEIKFEEGKAPENRKKNRFNEILPADDYRPFLQNGDSDYVNAILVNSYRTLAHFVVTQLPLANTVTDFWALVHERKCSTIIQLQTTDAPFLPPQDNRTIKYGMSSVNRKASQVEPNFRTIDVVLTFNNKPERKMKVFEVTSWDNKQALNEPHVMISLVDMVKKWQQQAGKGSVAVLCMDGSTRCGLYINISNALEKLEVETEVDVYNPVLMSRLRRPQFINSLEQYVYIYRVLRTYAEAFAEYSNFR